MEGEPLAERLDMTLRIWGTLRYLEQHKGDSPHSRSRGVMAIASFLGTNHASAKAVLQRCSTLEWVHGEPVRGPNETDLGHDKRNPWLYFITKEGEDELDRLDKVLRPIHFETMGRLERRVG